jgi:hypothetical protein
MNTEKERGQELANFSSTESSEIPGIVLLLELQEAGQKSSIVLPESGTPEVHAQLPQTQKALEFTN